MKYIAVLDTDEIEDFAFFEDGKEKYLHGIDANSVNGEWIYLPFKPLEQEPKTGRWIPSHIPESILDECSECGFSCGAFTFNYCPNCGADMREVEE